MKNNEIPRLDEIFSFTESRADKWRQLSTLAKEWVRQKATQDEVKQKLSRIQAAEILHAYPGHNLLQTLAAYLEQGHQEAFVQLAGRISFSIISKTYKENPKEWLVSPFSSPDSYEHENQVSDNETYRPYFELLIVAPKTLSTDKSIQLLRQQRRKEDDFIYEIVVVHNFQDALCAIASNGNIAAVTIFEGFDYQATDNTPMLNHLIQRLQDQNLDLNPNLSLRLVQAVKAFRPELDIYLLSDQRPEELATDPNAKLANRILYAVEEPVEVHLSILEGVRSRYQTPFFDNLKKYARRPISTFHALPIARGKSIFKSDWIRDMGEFYGLNLFLAESSATTGGLDSLLEPTGNIKDAQDKAAKAFGAEHCFFVTNGTSTSNKMVLMAIAKPGEIVILDRNCHKSHHYGMILGGLKPYYVEAYPMKAYSMYGAVPLVEIKKALLKLRREGKLHLVRAVDLTNCTFDGHVYNTQRVMEECLAIKPDLVFLWDEAWFGFARWSPFLRMRTGMGAASAIERWMEKESSVEAFEAQQAILGDNPSDELLLETRLIPDPRLVKLRVYQTNSTHKSMSAIRQGSMILVKDVYFHSIRPQLNEAIFTHSTTSPNQQLIASLDVARRQMDLEGYRLVNNAIQISLDIRNEINKHPLISKFFRVLGANEMIPDAFRESGFTDFLSKDITLNSCYSSIKDDEFFLDPTRMTLVCGTAGFDGTEFKGLLADKFDIQLNKTSRNSVLLQSNINNTRSDVSHLLRVLLEISQEIESRLQVDANNHQHEFEKRVRSLMHDVPDLPDFSFFYEDFRTDANNEVALEGDIRTAFFKSWDEDHCEYVGLFSEECDRRLKEGPQMVSAKLVIPYPPGFPILVPGQVIEKDTIDFMRKLDVKEIHGYDSASGLQLIRVKS